MLIIYRTCATCTVCLVCSLLVYIVPTYMYNYVCGRCATNMSAHYMHVAYMYMYVYGSHKALFS